MPTPGRVLFVTEKFPHPVDDGGQIRSWNVLARLAREMPVSLLALDAPSPADEAAVRDLGVEVACFGPRLARWTIPAFAVQALFTRAPYPMGKNFSRRLLEGVRSRIRAGGIAAVHWNHLDAAQYDEHLGPERAQVKTVFDTHNLLTRMYERFAREGANPLRRGYATVQWWKMARFEPEILRAVDRALVCSDTERELAHTWGVNGAMVVPNGVDRERFAEVRRRPRAAGEPPTVVFTGALSYAPNAEAVRWLLGEIAAGVRKVHPRVRNVIVGKGASPALTMFARPGEVEFTGWVDDVRPWLAQADVSVVPIRVGGGTRIKILEAMAAGVPVVSTTVGAEGIAARDGESIVLADDAAGFARAVAGLLTEPGRASSIAEHGRRLVRDRYGWDAVLEPLVEFYRQLG
jgi:glycosyltransferase involved in cell wall biosynthesis